MDETDPSSDRTDTTAREADADDADRTSGATDAPTPGDPAGFADPGLSRRVLLLEIVSVLLFAALPHLVHSLYLFGEAGEAAPGSIPGASTFVSHWIPLFLLSLQVFVPLLWIMARAPGGLARFADFRLRPLRDGGAAIAVGCAGFVITSLWTATFYPILQPLLSFLDPPMAVDWVPPSSFVEWGVVAAAYLLSAAAEELAMRVYLITRLIQIGLPQVVAVLAAGLVFASYHVYQGGWATTWVFWFGMVYGIAFLLTRRFWPLTLAHCAVNVITAASWTE